MLRLVALLSVTLPLAAHAIETVRISMGEVGQSLDVAASTLHWGADEDEALYRRLPVGRAEVRRDGSRLRLNGNLVAQEAIRFRAGEGAADAGIPGVAPLEAAGHRVRGDLVVRLQRGKLQLINVIPLEDYLVGVLGSEMPRSFPLEALKAQAVAARTYALHKKLSALDEPYHLGSGVLSQVYGGLKAEDPRTREAVESTRGLVLTYELAPIEAYFHASCGGRTESGLDALQRDLPYLKPVSCGCGKLSNTRWAVTLPESELYAALGSGQGAELRIVARSSTGRARRLQLGPSRVVDAVSFRERMGYTRVKSLSFQIESSRHAVKLTGRGYGHGAGLCQWGAKVYAEEGWDFEQILFHYYPGTELQTLY